MELYALQVFATVVTESSFSRAAEKLFRTQPAVSLALQRRESELGEKLIDRSAKGLVMTDAGRTVLEFARRFENLRQEVERRRFVGADGQAAGRPVAQLGERGGQLLLEVVEAPRVLEHDAPRVGQHQLLRAAHVAVDQRLAQLRLQTLDGERNGRLRAEQLLRGAGEAPLRHDRREHLQRVQLHRLILAEDSVGDKRQL